MDKDSVLELESGDDSVCIIIESNKNLGPNIESNVYPMDMELTLLPRQSLNVTNCKSLDLIKNNKLKSIEEIKNTPIVEINSPNCDSPASKTTHSKCLDTSSDQYEDTYDASFLDSTTSGMAVERNRKREHKINPVDNYGVEMMDCNETLVDAIVREENIARNNENKENSTARSPSAFSLFIDECLQKINGGTALSPVDKLVDSTSVKLSVPNNSPNILSDIANSPKKVKTITLNETLEKHSSNTADLNNLIESQKSDNQIGKGGVVNLGMNLTNKLTELCLNKTGNESPNSNVLYFDPISDVLLTNESVQTEQCTTQFTDNDSSVENSNYKIFENITKTIVSCNKSNTDASTNTIENKAESFSKFSSGANDNCSNENSLDLFIDRSSTAPLDVSAINNDIQQFEMIVNKTESPIEQFRDGIGQKTSLTNPQRNVTSFRDVKESPSEDFHEVNADCSKDISLPNLDYFIIDPLINPLNVSTISINDVEQCSIVVNEKETNPQRYVITKSFSEGSLGIDNSLSKAELCIDKQSSPRNIQQSPNAETEFPIEKFSIGMDTNDHSNSLTNTQRDTTKNVSGFRSLNLPGVDTNSSKGSLPKLDLSLSINPLNVSTVSYNNIQQVVVNLTESPQREVNTKNLTKSFSEGSLGIDNSLPKLKLGVDRQSHTVTPLNVTATSNNDIQEWSMIANKAENSTVGQFSDSIITIDHNNLSDNKENFNSTTEHFDIDLNLDYKHITSNGDNLIQVSENLLMHDNLEIIKEKPGETTITINSESIDLLSPDPSNEKNSSRSEETQPVPIVINSEFNRSLDDLSEKSEHEIVVITLDESDFPLSLPDNQLENESDENRNAKRFSEKACNFTVVSTGKENDSDVNETEVESVEKPSTVIPPLPDIVEPITFKDQLTHVCQFSNQCQPVQNPANSVFCTREMGILLNNFHKVPECLRNPFNKLHRSVNGFNQALCQIKMQVVRRTKGTMADAGKKGRTNPVDSYSDIVNFLEEIRMQNTYYTNNLQKMCLILNERLKELDFKANKVTETTASTHKQSTIPNTLSNNEISVKSYRVEKGNQVVLTYEQSKLKSDTKLIENSIEDQIVMMKNKTDSVHQMNIPETQDKVFVIPTKSLKAQSLPSIKNCRQKPYDPKNFTSKDGKYENFISTQTYHNNAKSKTPNCLADSTRQNAFRDCLLKISKGVKQTVNSMTDDCSREKNSSLLKQNLSSAKVNHTKCVSSNQTKNRGKENVSEKKPKDRTKLNETNLFNLLKKLKNKENLDKSEKPIQERETFPDKTKNLSLPKNNKITRRNPLIENKDQSLKLPMDHM